MYVNHARSKEAWNKREGGKHGQKGVRFRNIGGDFNGFVRCHGSEIWNQTNHYRIHNILFVHRVDLFRCVADRQVMERR